MSAPPSRPGILDIVPYKGGESALAGFTQVIKLASNESPLGPSPRARAAYRHTARRLALYPDGGCQALREALGRHHGVAPERIVCGNGSDELLDLCTRAYAGVGDEVLYSQYGFLVYPLSARHVGATPVAATERHYRADVDALLAQASPRTRVVFLANPNNPTGSYLAADEVGRLRKGLPDGTLLVIDAAYAEYVWRNDYTSGLELVERHDNVVMTRTFSKIYGLAALRLGWAYCPPDVADVLNRLREPFNVTAPAQAAGIAALADVAHLDRARAHNDAWLPRLSEALRGLGLEVAPSVANFILVRFPAERGGAPAADAQLRRDGIIVRDMRPYGLPEFLRITIGRAAENRAVIASLRRFMA